MTHRTSNHLRNENSPYLLQHALNPVDWFPWGNDALRKAKAENKLIIVSIGYAACHWCHVMEHESFEDEEVAEIMNRWFVAIKVDREERPDIDQVYMTAAYATTSRGGWPLNAIALPDQRPFFAGTYYQKKDWLYILKYYADLYRTNPHELDEQAGQIAMGMKRHFRLPVAVDPLPVSKEMVAELFRSIQPDLDTENGGTYGAPKFPMPAITGFLLHYGIVTGDNAALQHVRLTLDKMQQGGIFDHLGGGFCRYSTDARWHVPHFEKMLYDNAQLVSLYARASQHFKKYGWKATVEETIAFAERELTSPEGFFWSSIDADSENREGAFYVWTEEEIRRYLGPDPELFLSVYNCTGSGNWEKGLNVLHRNSSDEEFAAAHNLDTDELYACLQVWRRQLSDVRENRIRPATDDKILTGWNALMISGLTEAGLAFNRPSWLERAAQVAEGYRNDILRNQGRLRRNLKGEDSSKPAFHDDYALLTKAFLDLYQATFADKWLEMAEILTDQVLARFSAEDGIFFNLTPDDEPVVVMRSAELSDNVIPASNSVMAGNLFILGHLLSKEEYRTRAGQMAGAMIPHVRRNPAFHANWASLLLTMAAGATEIQITGDRAADIRSAFSGYPLPGVIWSGGTGGRAAGLKERHRVGNTLIWICRNHTCYPPVATVPEAMNLIAVKEDQQSDSRW